MKNLIFSTFFIVLLLFNCSNGNDDSSSNSDDDGNTEQFDYTVIDHLDYKQMVNWAFHPDKPINLMANYNLDIAVVDKDLNIESTIPITNNAVTDTGVDVFFVHPTVLTQITEPPSNIAIADQNGILITSTIIAQAGLLAKYGRLFAPRYKQSTGPTYTSETTSDELQREVITNSYADIRAAFIDYLENYNNGNKIILAGHSQGSHLVGMLLRDLFDDDSQLQGQLVTAALGGLAYIYAEENNYKGGWFQNMPLCTTQNECGCIQTWAMFDDEQDLPDPNTALPAYNPDLASQGLYYRNIESSDWFLQDETYYTSSFTSLEYYITPGQGYSFGNGANFIAFKNMYNVRIKRETLQKAAITIEYTPEVNDLRPNELEDEKSHPNYSNWGYHTKDYHLYIWDLMKQIDLKLQNCP